MEASSSGALGLRGPTLVREALAHNVRWDGRGGIEPCTKRQRPGHAPERHGRYTGGCPFLAAVEASVPMPPGLTPHTGTGQAAASLYLVVAGNAANFAGRAD
jgi:hypothetical protein